MDFRALQSIAVVLQENVELHRSRRAAETMAEDAKDIRQAVSVLSRNPGEEWLGAVDCGGRI